MKKLKVHDWEEHQSYRKDRGRPPWIKIHRHVMQNHKWVMLSDAERGQLVTLWIIAANDDGHIPYDEDILSKMCFSSSKINLKKFIDSGWLRTVTSSGCQDDVKLASSGRQVDAPEAEAEAETEAKAETEAEAEAEPTGKLSCLAIPDTSNEKLDYEKIKELYEINLCPPMQRVRYLTASLKEIIKEFYECRLIRKVCKEENFKTPDNLFSWYFNGIKQCPFLLGSDNGKKTKWVADIYWILDLSTENGASNVEKIINGKYLNKKNAGIKTSYDRMLALEKKLETKELS